MARKKIIVIFQVGVSITLLSILLFQHGSSIKLALYNILTSNEIILLVMAVIFHYLDKLLRIFNLRLLLEQRGVSIPYLKLLKITLISNFLGFFIPGSSGPDLVRILHLKKYYEGYAGPTSATLLLNIVSVFSAAILTFSGVGILIYMKQGLSQEIQIIILSYAGIIIFICLALFLTDVRRIILNILNIKIYLKFEPILRFIRNVMGAVNEYLVSKRVLLSFFISMVGLLSAVMRTFYLSNAGGLHVPFIYYLVLVSGLVLITMVPVTFAGIGVREYTFVFFLSAVGVDEGNALIIGLLVTALNISVAIVGGVVFFFGAIQASQRT